MTQVFLKKEQLELINGGYLSSTESGQPVTNADFVQAQEKAHYVVTFAKVFKSKDLKGKTPDSLEDIITEVQNTLAEKDVTYVTKAAKPAQELTDKLVKEALAFVDFKKEEKNNDLINDFMQQFNVLTDFETFGLFFENGIVKLPKIYTVAEILEAVTTCIDVIKK